MPLAPLSPQTFAFIAQVDEAYAALTAFAPHHGGHLLYAGELNEPVRALTIAANIAGAATLTAATDAAAGKQALHDGIIDFLVTSLDEALRILKNELRKHQPAAVCVTASSGVIEAEMEARGVLPDLAIASAAHVACNAARPPHIIDRLSTSNGPAQTWLTWRVAESPALWLPKIDAIALATLAPAEGPARNWLQLAPRYLGRLATNTRIVHTTTEQAHRFIEQLRAELDIAAIPVRLEQGPWGDSKSIHL